MYVRTLEWLTLPDVAKRWGVTRAWVWRLVNEGGIPKEWLARQGDRHLLDPKYVDRVSALVDAARVDGKVPRGVVRDAIVEVARRSRRSGG